MATHLPTAIATLFGTPYNCSLLSINRSVRIGFYALSDLLIGDNFFIDKQLTAWERLYKNNARWGDIYYPSDNENRQVYQLFFNYPITSMKCIITDDELDKYMKTIYTTTYTRWCIAICKNLWVLKSIEKPEIGTICRDILLYMKETIYKENELLLNMPQHHEKKANPFKKLTPDDHKKHNQ